MGSHWRAVPPPSRPPATVPPIALQAPPAGRGRFRPPGAGCAPSPRSPPDCRAGCRSAGNAAGRCRGGESPPAWMPTGWNGSTSRQRTSRYSMPRSPSACQGPLAAPDGALRPDGPVELVLDLQERGGELAIVVAVAQADGLVGRIGIGESPRERGRVPAQVVEAHRERCLRVALVTQPPHAQRSRPRGEYGSGLPRGQPVAAARDERAAGRGRGPSNRSSSHEWRRKLRIRAR